MDIHVTVHIEEALHVDLLERARMPSIRRRAPGRGLASDRLARAERPSQHPPETKERVLDAIRVLDYRPNVAARALATSRSNTLGILSATTGEFGPTSSIAAIEDAARAEGYSVSTLNLPDTTPEAIGAAVRQLCGSPSTASWCSRRRCASSTCCAGWRCRCRSSACRRRRARTASAIPRISSPARA
jgi:hypothetical protein